MQQTTQEGKREKNCEHQTRMLSTQADITLIKNNSFTKGSKDVTNPNILLVANDCCFYSPVIASGTVPQESNRLFSPLHLARWVAVQELRHRLV